MAAVTRSTSAPAQPEAPLNPNADTTAKVASFGPAAERLVYLDALRGLAVVLMVQQHLGIWLTAVHKVRGGLMPLVIALNSLGGAAAPLFVFLSGVGVSLGAHLSGPVFVRRAFALGICAYLLNLACPSWLSPGSFYVLHLIAAFWLVAPLLRRVDGRWLLGLFVLGLVLTVVVQTALETPPYLSNARLRNTSLPGGPLRLALAEGHFPLLPWLSFGILGIWAGRKIQSGQTSSLTKLGLVLLAAYVLLRLPRIVLSARDLRRLPWRSVVDFSFYPASVAFVLGLGGVCALLVILTARAGGAGRASSPSGQPRVATWLADLGRTSLTLLVLHVVIFREGTAAVGLYQRIPPGLVLLLIALVLGGFALVSRAWGRAGYRYSLEWWVRRAGGRTNSRGRSEVTGAAGTGEADAASIVHDLPR